MGGTAFSGGIFMDISMIYSDKIDYSVLPEKDIYLHLWKENENVFVIVHEFFHTFQMLLNKNFISDLSNNVDKKLFYFSIIEGGANFFMTKILSEENPPSDLKDQIEYMKHNPQKYLEFWNDIKEQEKIDNKEEKSKISLQWLYNASTEKVKNGFYPADLGYYIGQKITQKFFEEEIKTRNQETVLKQILRLDVPDERIEKILTALSKGM